MVRWLHEAWQVAEWLRLGRRRPPISAVFAGHVGYAAGSARLPTAAGALRTGLVGAAIPQTVAAKWMGTAACPACGAARKDRWRSRFWECLAWAGVRSAAGLPAAPAEAPRGLCATGVLAVHPALRAHRLAAAAAQRPVVPIRSRVLYTGSSVVDGAGPELARGAWAAVWYEGGWHKVVEPCGERQAAPRAELSVVAWEVRRRWRCARCRRLLQAAVTTSSMA